MITQPKTFGVLDRVDISDVHVIEVKGGTPLGDLPESATPAWASGTFAIGDQRSLASTHSIYTCIKAHTTAGGKTPAQDGENWKFYAVTERWRAFDLYRSTKVVAADVLRIVLRPFALIDAIDLQGVRADTVTITITDGVGGPDVYPATAHTLNDPSISDYEPYFYGPTINVDSLYVNDLPICGDPVVTIELAFSGNQVELGSLQIGSFVSLGWTEYETDVGVVSYSYLKELEDGTIQYRKRPGAGDMNVRVLVEPSNAARVMAMLEKYDGLPTLWVGHTWAEFSPLRKTGFFDGRLSYPNFAQRSLTGRVRGVI